LLYPAVRSVRRSRSLGTHCRSDNRLFERYVLREYTVYRLYNLLTPFSFRARLVRATYVDTAKKKTIDAGYAMFIEDDPHFFALGEGHPIANAAFAFFFTALGVMQLRAPAGVRLTE
jgi:hypothetical protein